VCIKFGCYDNVLLIKETTRLEPGVVEYKYYASDVGFILSVMIKGGDERTELASIGSAASDTVAGLRPGEAQRPNLTCSRACWLHPRAASPTVDH